MNRKQRSLRPIAVLLCAVLLVVGILPGAIFPACAQFYGGRIGDNITWVLDTESGLLEIEGSGDAPEDTWQSPWRDYRTAIRSVTIQSGITSLWHATFLGCTELTDVTLPDTLKCIGEAAFTDCTALRALRLPDGLERIEPNAFSHSGLEDIYVPDSVTDLPGSTFYCCEKLRHCRLPEGMETVPYFCFYGCSSLKSIDFPSTLKYITEGGLFLCTTLEELDLPDTMEEVQFDSILYTPYARDPSHWKDGCLYSGNILLAVDPAHTGACVVADGTACIAHHAFLLYDGDKHVDNPNVSGVVLPESVRYVPQDAFGPSLHTICFAGTPDQWHEITKNYAPMVYGNYYHPSYTVKASVIYHAHTDDQLRYAETLEPTCVNMGGTGGVTYYANCCTIKEAGQLLPALGHEMPENVRTSLAPGKHLDGYTANWQCRRCKQYYFTYLPATGHLFTDWTTNCPSTCTQQGTEICKCSNCSKYSLRFIPTDPDNHTDSALRGEIPAGCVEAGYSGDTYCIACGKTIDAGVVLPALGHNYDAAVTAPTCTAEGFTTYTCTQCGDKYIADTVPASGHIWDAGAVTLAPTETAEGVRTLTCTVCGQTETQSIPALVPPVLDRTALRLAYKDTAVLSASVPVTWQSSDASVVQVQPDGLVTAVGKGTAVVTAQAVQGGQTAACTVEVSYTWWQILIRIFLFGFLWY